MTDTILKPTVIEEVSFPETTQDISGSNSSGNATILTPQETIERKLPDVFVARTVIADSIDTKTRKILSNYTFGEYGGISIGKYQNGVSGDIRISPNGIVTRNKDGDVTIGLDGDTGDATFKGQLLAGNVITGGIDIIGSGAINFNDGINKAVLDASGLVSSNSFAQTNTANASLNQGITGTNETDITGATLSFTQERTGVVLILYTVSVYMTQSAGNTGNLVVRLKFNNDGSAYDERARLIFANVPTTDSSLRTHTGFWVQGFGRHERNVKLTGQLESVTGNPTGTIYSYSLSYLKLGT